MINKEISKWLNNQRKKQLLTVERIILSKLNKWIYNNREIYHKSKKFFKITGLRIKSNFYDYHSYAINFKTSKNWYTYEFPLKDAVKAHEAIESGKTEGSIIMLP